MNKQPLVNLTAQIDERLQELAPGQTNGKLEQKRKKTLIEYYNLRNKDIHLENDSSFSQQSHVEDATDAITKELIGWTKDEILKKEIQQEEKLKHLSPQEKTSNVHKNALAKEIISAENMKTDNDEIPRMSTFQSQSASQQSQGFDILSDFLREIQSKKFHFEKNSLNFHNTLHFDRTATKNEGGSGNYMSYRHNIQNHLRKPKEIVRDKQSQIDTLTTPHHLKYQAVSANQALETDKILNSRDSDYLTKTRDISYRADAVKTAIEVRKSKRLSRPIVESSVDQIASNEKEKHLLAGVTPQQLPSDLNDLERLMKERRLQLSDMIEDVESYFPTRHALPQSEEPTLRKQASYSQSQQQIKRPQHLIQNVQSQTSSSINRPQTKMEQSIFKKHMVLTKPQTNHGRFLQYQQQQRHTNSQMFPRSKNSKSVTELPTVNIKINTNNYYYDGQSTVQTGADTISQSNYSYQPQTEGRAPNVNNILMNPTSRKDAETLYQWFRMMLQKIDSDLTTEEEMKNNQRQTVYLGAFQELQQQVIVQCKNRGDLLSELWTGFFKDLQRQLKTLKIDKLTQEQKLKTEIEDSNIFYLNQLKRKNSEIDKLQLIIDDLQQKLKNMESNFEDQKIEAERWKLKCENVFKKYKENKFKLLNAETQKMKTLNGLGIHQTLIFRKQLKDTLEKDEPIENDLDFDGILEEQLEAEGISGELESPTKLVSNNKSYSAQPPMTPAKLNQSGINNKPESTLQKLQQKKRKVGAFHQDLNTLMAKKNVGLKTFVNKAVDTRDFFDQTTNEQAVQTMNMGTLLSQLASEENAKAPVQRFNTRDSISLINFDKDIDNILEQEVNLKSNGDTSVIVDSPSLKTQADLAQNTTSSNPQPSDINTNVNKVMSGFAAGLKHGILQKVIQKLKESFKSKELLLRQLMEENRDLFQQLDIEKAKFHSVIKEQHSENTNLVELQNQLEEMQKKHTKERSRHQYYKELIQELSQLKEVRKKINMSLSDLDENDFNSASSRNHQIKSRGTISQYRESSFKKRDSDLRSKSHKQVLDDESDMEGEDSISQFLIENSSSDDDDAISLQNDKRRKLTTPMKKKRQVSNLHPSNVFIQKLYKKLNLPGFHKISCTLKALLKTINLTYTSLLAIYKKELPDLKNSFVLKQGCIEFMYDQFIRSSGIKKLSEKKFAQTISAVMRFKGKIQRARLFGRFLGLFDPFDKENFKFYLTCLNYILNVSTFGYLVPVTDNDEVHWAPYIRVSDFMRTYFENKITPDEYQDLRSQIDKLKENDFKKNRNTFIVDQDKAIEILLEQHLKILNNKKGNVQDLFLAFDFENMELIGFQAFYLLITHAEEKKFTYLQIRDLFDKNADYIGLNTTKEASKLLTLDQFISICFQEKLFHKENQAYFLQLTNSDDMHQMNEEILDKAKTVGITIKKDLELISMRYSHKIPLYIQDLITLVQSLLQLKADQFAQQSKTVWIIYRTLLEESKRAYIENLTSNFLHQLDSFTTINQGLTMTQEEQSMFCHRAYKNNPKKIAMKSSLQLTHVTNIRKSGQAAESIMSPISPVRTSQVSNLNINKSPRKLTRQIN